MNSDMIKPKTFGHLHLVYHFTVPLKALEQHWNNLFECNFADLGYVFAYFLRN